VPNTGRPPVSVNKRPLFREVNERIREVNTSPSPEIAAHEILLCECGRADCSERLEVPLEVYDVVRSEGHRFLVVPGHEQPDLEEVVAGTPTYLVVAQRTQPV
jgi:hypothetical protein